MKYYKPPSVKVTDFWCVSVPSEPIDWLIDWLIDDDDDNNNNNNNNKVQKTAIFGIERLYRKC